MKTTYETTNPLRLAWYALVILYDDLFVFVGLSLLTWLSLILLIPAFPALAALHEMARLAITKRAISVRQWWEYARTEALRAWKLGAIALLITIVFFANVLFYGRQETSVWRYIAIFWLWLSVMGTMTWLYVWPVMALQEERRLWMLLRNAFYMALLRPFHTLMAALVLAFFTSLSVLLPILLALLPAYWAVYTTLLTREIILAIQKENTR